MIYDQKKLDELLAKMLDDSLTGNEQQALQDILTDTEARQYYEDYIDTHVHLDWYCGGASLDLPSGLEGEINTNRKQSAKPILYFVMAIAALVLLVFFFLPKSIAQIPVQIELVNGVGAEWQDRQLYESGHVFEQKTFHLTAGYVELKNKDGVHFILEGPAELDVLGNNDFFLKKGKILANVPSEEIGFTVRTPKTTILDKGTEFGVSVEENGDTEVHVLEGKVETINDHKKTVLNKTESVLITSAGFKSQKADGSKFMRMLPGKTDADIGYIHWRFDEGVGSIAESEDRILGHYPATLTTSLKDKTDHAEWDNGQFGSAIKFDGVDDYLKTDFPGIGGNNPRTISFWVKIPKEAEIKHSKMLSWGSYKGAGRTWQISWNWRKEDGVVGALRCGLYHGQVVGSQDLRDGRWHHCAVVMYGGDGANVNTHILLYVDAMLESSSKKSLLDIKTDLGGSDKTTTVLMGRDAMAYINRNRSNNVFKGWMDEVFIFDAALSQDAIQQLMQRNSCLEME